MITWTKVRVLIWLAVAALLGARGPAEVGRAAVIGPITVQDNSTAADISENRREAQSESTLVAGSTSTYFNAVHRHVAAADAALGFRQDVRPTFRFTVKTQVYAAPDELWQFNLDTTLKGTVLVVDDTGPGGLETANAYIKQFGFTYASKNALLGKGTLLIDEDFEVGTTNVDGDVDVNDTRSAAFSGRGSQEIVIELT